MLKTNPHLGLLFLRIFVSLRLIYGVIDNIVSWDQMLEFSHFLEQNLFPFPLASAVFSVYAQGMAGLAILLDFRSEAH